MSQTNRQSHFRNGHHVVVVILILIAGVAVIVRCRSGWRVEGESAEMGQSIELRLDPNVASAEELAAIPGVGPAMAGRIVAYRNREHASGHSQAFSELADLDRVEGIGQATLEEIGPFLRFGVTRK